MTREELVLQRDILTFLIREEIEGQHRSEVISELLEMFIRTVAQMMEVGGHA